MRFCARSRMPDPWQFLVQGYEDLLIKHNQRRHLEYTFFGRPVLVKIELKIAFRKSFFNKTAVFCVFFAPILKNIRENRNFQMGQITVLISAQRAPLICALRVLKRVCQELFNGTRLDIISYRGAENRLKEFLEK